jgi:gamma-polyglutamate biosynthesis protein CapA
MSRSIAVTIVFFCALLMGGVTFYHPNFSFGAFLQEFAHTSEEVVDHKNGITFVGDVMLARKVADLSQWYGASYPFHRLGAQRTDYFLVGNFESTVPVIYTRTPYFTFSFATPTSSIPALREYGFTHLSLANNHSYDKGVGGFEHTVAVLAQHGMQPFGQAYSISSSSITFLDVSETKVSIIGLSLLAGTPPIEEVATIVGEAASLSDVQVAYVHWGTEYAPYHNQSQRRFAELLVSLGVDVIIGHHPHVIQDVDLIAGVPVFYSLGNFVFDQYFSSAVQEGLVLDFEVSPTELLIKLSGVTSIDKQSAPRPMVAIEQDELLSRIAQKSHMSIAEMVSTGTVVVPR